MKKMVFNTKQRGKSGCFASVSGKMNYVYFEDGACQLIFGDEYTKGKRFKADLEIYDDGESVLLVNCYSNDSLSLVTQTHGGGMISSKEFAEYLFRKGLKRAKVTSNGANGFFLTKIG